MSSTNPLTSTGFDRPASPHSETSSPATRPIALGWLRPAAAKELPDYVYDPQRQVAVDAAGVTLAPQLGKEWTSDGTHTDGDGGDNEGWSWEE